MPLLDREEKLITCTPEDFQQDIRSWVDNHEDFEPKHIACSGCSLTHDDINKILRFCQLNPSITSINLSACDLKSLPDSFAKSLQQLNIKHLNLSLNPLSTDSVVPFCEQLTQGTTLTSLDLSNVLVDGSTWISILTQLKSLPISLNMSLMLCLDVEQPNAAQFKRAFSGAQWHALNISNNNLTDQALKTLLEQLPKTVLRKFNIIQSKGMTCDPHEFIELIRQSHLNTIDYKSTSLNLRHLKLLNSTLEANAEQSSPSSLVDDFMRGDCLALKFKDMVFPELVLDKIAEYVEPKKLCFDMFRQGYWSRVDKILETQTENSNHNDAPCAPSV